jgi:hypothetical protein
VLQATQYATLAIPVLSNRGSQKVLILTILVKMTSCMISCWNEYEAVASGYDFIHVEDGARMNAPFVGSVSVNGSRAVYLQRIDILVG